MAEKEKECSEIIEGFLYLGRVATAKNLSLLKKHGISHILNIAGAQFHVGEFVYRQIHFDDNQLVDIFSLLDSCFDFMDQAFFEKGRILVHILFFSIDFAKFFLTFCSQIVFKEFQDHQR